MAENPKLDLGSGANLTSSRNDCGFEDMDTQKISVISDFKNEKSDSFVVDIESFSHGTDKDANANSRITLQRSLSRKVSQRLGEKTNERDTVVATSSPRAALVGGCNTPEIPMAVAVGSTTNNNNTTTDQHPQVHHQITITTESKWGGNKRSNSFRRSTSWTIDPRKILFFFATLSSMGTILLIYFTLSIRKFNAEEDGFIDWQP